MGSRASQLRNRQQVQDSSAGAVVDASGDQLTVTAQDRVPNGNGLDGNTHFITDNNNIEIDDVARIKEAIHANGNHAQLDQQLAEAAVTQQQVNGEASAIELAASAKTSRKGSTLSRQASQIQSLAQRLRRSSSLRAPKLRALIPSFGKRKASADSSSPQVVEQPTEQQLQPQVDNNEKAALENNVSDPQPSEQQSQHSDSQPPACVSEHVNESEPTVAETKPQEHHEPATHTQVEAAVSEEEKQPQESTDVATIQAAEITTETPEAIESATVSTPPEVALQAEPQAPAQEATPCEQPEAEQQLNAPKDVQATESEPQAATTTESSEIAKEETVAAAKVEESSTESAEQKVDQQQQQATSDLDSSPVTDKVQEVEQTEVAQDQIITEEPAPESGNTLVSEQPEHLEEVSPVVADSERTVEATNPDAAVEGLIQPVKDAEESQPEQAISEPNVSQATPEVTSEVLETPQTEPEVSPSEVKAEPIAESVSADQPIPATVDQSKQENQFDETAPKSVETVSDPNANEGQAKTVSEDSPSLVGEEQQVNQEQAIVAEPVA